MPFSFVAMLVMDKCLARKFELLMVPGLVCIGLLITLVASSVTFAATDIAAATPRCSEKSTIPGSLGDDQAAVPFWR